MALPTSYQRVITATNYDASAGLPYLRFDGVDDSLSTNSISFTSTDKMSVFAGVRKLVESSSGGIVVELSATTASNNGSFMVLAPDAGASNYGFGSRGTIRVAPSISGTIPPETATLTLLADINSPQLVGRKNGTQIVQSAASQGTGNYSNNPLYLGRRGGSSLPFNGQLYSMIIVGKAVTAGELSSTETYVNQKTGAY